jgi:hypothetical protein
LTFGCDTLAALVNVTLGATSVNLKGHQSDKRSSTTYICIRANARTDVSSELRVRNDMTSFFSPPLKSLTPELLIQLKEQSQRFLFDIISVNCKSKFCQTADELTIFRHAVETLRDDEQGFLQNFRDLIPLTVYDTYRPFVDRFFNTPCLESEVVDLFAPGLPFFIAVSSATSGKAPKFFPKYKGTTWRRLLQPHLLLVRVYTPMT